MIKKKLVAKPLTRQSFVKAPNSNIFQIINKIKETVDKEQLIKSSSKILLSISGGQDSIFLLFCLSFLQSQLNFCFKIVWCNHFWQSDSFYTTLHLTKSARAFSSPIVGFVPLGFSTLAFPYRAVPQIPFRSFLTFSKLFRKSYASRLQTLFASGVNFCPYKVQSFYQPICSANCKLRLPICSANCLLHKATFQGQKVSPRSLRSKAFPLLELPSGVSGASEFAASMGFDTQNRGLRGKSKYNRILCFPRERKHNIIMLNTPLKKQKKFIETVSEDTARNWRHITIERSYAFYNMNRCVYGHTLSDRVETILFNLIRGTGSRGAALLALKREHASFCYNKFFPCLEQLKKKTHLNNR